jgi:hypothetical protein
VFVWMHVDETPALWVVSPPPHWVRFNEPRLPNQAAASGSTELEFAPGGYGAVGGTHSASRRGRSFRPRLFTFTRSPVIHANPQASLFLVRRPAGT